MQMHHKYTNEKFKAPIIYYIYIYNIYIRNLAANKKVLFE